MASDGETYREECHVSGCETQFIGIRESEYINHLRGEHGELVGDIWDRLLVDDEPDADSETALEPIRCKQCGSRPQACWNTNEGSVALICSCGARTVPPDSVLDHSLMPERTSWTVEE